MLPVFETNSMESFPQAANENHPNEIIAIHPLTQAFVSELNQQPVEGGTDPVYGEVTWRTLISGDRTSSKDLILGVADFPAHGSLNPHRHAPPEFYFCLSGSGTVVVDGLEFEIQTGSAVFIPGNAEHGVTAGPHGLSFAYGFAQHTFADIDYVFSDVNV